MDSGATLKIRNNGILAPIIDDTHTFEVPQGAILDFEKGSIAKSSTEFVILN